MDAKRKVHTPEFKPRAAQTVTEQLLSLAEAARRPGVHEGRLHEWKEAHPEGGLDAFPGSGRQTPLGAEPRRLRAEVKRLEMERDILKEATAFPAALAKGPSPGSRNAAPITRSPCCVAYWACRGPGIMPGGRGRPATPSGDATTC